MNNTPPLQKLLIVDDKPENLYAFEQVLSPLNVEEDPIRFMDVLNRTLYNNIQRLNVDNIVTLSLLDYQNGQVRLSGQHEQLIVVHTNGQTELIDTRELGFPLGLEIDIAQFVDEISIKLQPGEGVVLYSDGITEAENMNEEFYGLERLCQVISQTWPNASAEQVKQAVIDDVKQYIGQQKVYDDLTLVVLKQQ
jgi:serine phosphatase RsbU (regulator of sigma subunit)